MLWTMPGSFFYCSGVLQKGKAKAAASASASQPVQPQLVSQRLEGEDSEAASLEQDIVSTTELLQTFSAHSDAWEALEVGTHPLFAYYIACVVDGACLSYARITFGQE